MGDSHPLRSALETGLFSAEPGRGSWQERVARPKTASFTSTSILLPAFHNCESRWQGHGLRDTWIRRSPWRRSGTGGRRQRRRRRRRTAPVQRHACQLGGGGVHEGEEDLTHAWRVAGGVRGVWAGDDHLPANQTQRGALSVVRGAVSGRCQVAQSG